MQFHAFNFHKSQTVRKYDEILFAISIIHLSSYMYVTKTSLCLYSCIFGVISTLQQLPTMSNLQTELKVYFEDENTGQYSSAYYFPIINICQNFLLAYNIIL